MTKVIELAHMLGEEIAKSENVCVVGGQPQLDGCGEKLAEIRQILA